MRYESAPVTPVERPKTTRERAAHQRRERQEELRYTASDEKRWAENRERVLAERKPAQQAYDLTKEEWNKDLTGSSERIPVGHLTARERQYCRTNS